MFCKILQTIYGRDTRSAQMVNILFCGIWAIALWLHSRGTIILALPVVVNHGIFDVIIVALAATVFGVMGLVTKGQRHQVIKFFGISLGAVLQGVLANGYFTVYPPLEVMLVINLAVFFWFLGALLYIAKCEGFDGNYLRTR